MDESPVRVIHVDDDKEFVHMAAELLERESERLAVTPVSDPETALEMLASGSYDCVVSDYQMPGTDGLALLRRVRADHPALPFVLFTGEGSEAVASDAISAGVTDYLQKGSGLERFALLANRVLNVVERHRAEIDRTRLAQEVSTEREHFRLALENSPVVAFRLDRELRYTWVGNPHPDFDVEGVLGRRDDDLLPPEAAETVMTPKREALETGEGVRRRVSYELPSGPVSYDLTVEPMRDETGEVVGLACAALDVSEYVGERRDLELVLERISDAFFALDRDWRFTYVNDRAAELLDRRAEALVGERVWEAFPEAADSTFRRQYERAMETQETVTFAEYYPPLSTWFEVRAYPSETGLSVYFRDVTAAKEREREQAERRRLFETLGDTLAHDACTPIASLRGRLELARSDENPEEHLEAAERSLDRLETLVEEFADVMREGGAVTDVREVDLGATAERVWESFETPAATLRFEADGTIRADEDALARLLQNLFRNSVEHGSPGTRAAGEAVEDGNQVTVTVGLLGDDGFYVDDDGPGVPPDRREAVFDPGETSKPDGTGFGLVGVRQIALAHGWRLQLTENEAGGARFEFRRVEGVDAAAGTTA